MSAIRSFFDKNEFLRHVLTLLTGSVFASAIPLLFSPIIARLYTPTEFGVYAIITAGFNLFVNIAGGRYEMTVMLPKDNADSRNLIALTSRVAFVFSLFLLVLIFLFETEIKATLEVEGLRHWLFIIPFLLWFGVMYKPFTFWLNKQKQYRYTAWSKMIQGTAIALGTVILGQLDIQGGLILGYLFGWTLFVMSLGYFHNKTGGTNHQVSHKEMKRLAIEYKDFPLVNALPTFMNDIAVQLVIFIIATYYTAEETGFFNFSRQYAYAPLSLIVINIGSVYYQRITERINTKSSLWGEFKRVFLIVGLAVAAFVLVIHFFAEELFLLVFGEQWGFSGKITSILVFGYALKLLTSPFVNLLPALNRLKLAAAFPVMNLSLTLLLLFVNEVSFADFISYIVGVEVLAYGTLLVLIIIALRHYEDTLVRNSE